MRRALGLLLGLAACHRAPPPVPAIRAARVATDAAAFTDTQVVAGSVVCTFRRLADGTRILLWPAVDHPGRLACATAFLVWSQAR